MDYISCVHVIFLLHHTEVLCRTCHTPNSLSVYMCDISFCCITAVLDRRFVLCDLSLGGNTAQAFSLAEYIILIQVCEHSISYIQDLEQLHALYLGDISSLGDYKQAII